MHPNDVGQSVEDLFNSLPTIVHPLLNNFEDTYVGRNHPQGRSRPTFEIPFGTCNKEPMIC